MRLPLVVRRHGATALVVTLSVALQVVVWTDAVFEDQRGWNAAAALGFGLSLFALGRMPLVPLIVGMAILATPGLNELANSGVLAFGIIASLYACGVSAREAVRWAGLVLGLVSVVITAVNADPLSLNDSVWVAVIVLAPWSAGRLVRRGRDRARLLEHRNVRLEETHEETAVRASAEERVRIARELHDVVAHALSLVVVQARGGRRMIHRGRNEEALEGLDTIEQAAQDALVEMRRLLGMLRDDSHDGPLAPRPGLARLPELVSRMEASGLPVHLDVLGVQRELPAGVDVSAYRVVQEALTNVVRHAAATQARVTLTYNRDNIEIAVIDDGRAAPSHPQAGHGLVGMRERVSLYGGDIETGARPEGGYAVNVRLPVSAE